jgi:hypothetical protein
MMDEGVRRVGDDRTSGIAVEVTPKIFSLGKTLACHATIA